MSERVVVNNRSHKKAPEATAPEKQEGVRLKRIFVLDTNVLLHDANAIFSFHGVVIGIPFVVLEELDTFKKESDEKGRNAREVIRSLDELRSRGRLSEGVDLNHNTGGSILRVLQSPSSSFSPGFHSVKDNLILQTVQDLVQKGFQATLVSKDINARVKADALDLDAEDYTKGKVSYDEYYKGWTRLALPALEVKTMTSKKLASYIEPLELKCNQFIILESENNPENNRLFRFLGGQAFKEVPPFSIMHTFSAKNIQQLMTIDLLMDDSIQIITLLGPAGTGKTFLTLLVGLYKVATEKLYRKLLVTRPVIALGADIGFLPGDVQEKLHYWMQPVHDNLEFISSQILRSGEDSLNLNRVKKDKKKGKEQNEHQQQQATNMANDANIVDRLQERGILSLEAITYMRGRSIPNQFLFIDEVQNLTPHEVKTIVSRAGEGTKVVLAGDPYQIDSPYLDFSSNGLTVTTEKLKDLSIFGTAFLEISERSELAKIAAELL